MSAAIKLDTREDAYALLQRPGATPHLLLHLQLVGEAADELIALFGTLGVACDAQAIELGAALHDAGKIQYPNEISGPG
ncbi:metal dependent phosphohydrolase, partial [mine drainage metagenome]